jgi:hypothetical protein
MNFAETFPSIATLEATLEIDGKGIQGLSQRMRLDVSNFRELITCANPRCHRGGFSIGDILRAMDVKNRCTSRIWRFAGELSAGAVLSA